MSVFDSIAEVDAHIAACKAALLSSTGSTSYMVDTGVSRTTIEKNSPKDLRMHLDWLRTERAALSGTGGAQVLHGRPSR